MRAVLISILLLTGSAAAAQSGDKAAGEKLFMQCKICHTTAKGAPNGLGPNLSGIFGAKAGARAGYVSSPAMAKSGLTWTAANLDPFLTRPSAKVPGTKMVFGGVADAKARANLIAYLASLKAK